MTFARPLFFIAALVALAGFAWLYRALERRRAARAFAFSNLAFALDALRPSRWPTALLFGAYVAGVGALLLALAGPHFVARVPTKDGTVVLCIDTSGSMRARDVAPTRAAAATAAALTFIDAVPAGTRVGIVTFATGASLIVAPTNDLDAVRSGIERIPPPNGATAIGDALALAGQQMPGHGRRVIVLLTDGINNRGADPLDAAHTLAVRGISIETVGVGSRGSGETIPGTSELADLDADVLRAIAQDAHGRYVEAFDAQTLARAFRSIALDTVWERKRVDGSLPVALAGGALLLASFLFGLGVGKF